MSRLESIFRLGLAVGGMAVLSACATDRAQPVSPQDFYARHNPNPSPISSLDQPGILPSLPDARPQGPPPIQAPPVPRNSEPISESEDSDVEGSPPASPATTTPSPTTHPGTSLASTTNPSTEPALATDQYMTLGGVVAVVNGTPIYANKVIRLLTPILRQYAHEYDIYEFEDNARTKIMEQIRDLENDELEVAAAERSLDPKDIQIAWGLAHQWREDQVAEAGGSEQLAQVRAQQAASGEDFEDQEQDKYRYYLWLLYRIRKINPDIQFTADDERRYFQDHMDEFTTPTQATVILIEADPDKRNQDPAVTKKSLEDIRRRALQGEDFAAYARNQNDLPGAAGASGTGGLMADIKPHSLVFTQVDAAIWTTPVGQISDVIADSDAFFLVKVVSRDDGSTRAFADSAVQDFIHTRLEDTELRAQRQAAIDKLYEEGVATSDPQMVDVAVEMALQNYPRWAKEKP